MPPYALQCSSNSSGWTISSSCILASNSIVSGNVHVQTGKVLIIPSGIKLTIPFTSNNLTIDGGGTVLVEPTGIISN